MMNDYSIDEIVEQIEDEFGFISKIQENGDTYIISILIDAITKINLVISLEDTDTGYAVREYHLDFPDKSVDLKDTSIILEAYQSAIEVTYLINECLERMGITEEW